MAIQAPYGLRIIEDCITCPHRQDRIFCNLSPLAIERLAAITSGATYPKGAILFVEGQQSRGVFILCSGRVKLSTSSADGKSLILKMAEPGDVLGLAAVVSGRPYEVTAEVLESCQANFIGREKFRDFLEKYGEVACRVATLMSEIYHSAFMEMRNIGLSSSAEEKLARLICELAKDQNGTDADARIKLGLTHEEIAQMIGSSRETVTRALSNLKRKKIVQARGSTLVVRDRRALHELAKV